MTSYIYADIAISPYSEMASDILMAFLSEAGYDSFENTQTGLKAYINKDDFSESTLASVLESVVLPEVEFSYTVHELENRNWNSEWEQNSFDPVLEREFGIRLAPRMAFGSGTHETTHQIVALLCAEDFSGQRVLDMGTGTGVLAIAMAQHGAREVVAIDIDEFSVENARDNFTLNDLEQADIRLGDASAIDGMFDTIVANIHKNILLHDLPTYVEHLNPGGTLFLSGFFTDDVEEMTTATKPLGLEVVKTTEDNDWAVIRLTKKNSTN